MQIKGEGIPQFWEKARSPKWRTGVDEVVNRLKEYERDIILRKKCHINDSLNSTRIDSTNNVLDKGFS